MVLQGLWGLKPPRVVSGPTGSKPISPLASSPGLSTSSHQRPRSLARRTESTPVTFFCSSLGSPQDGTNKLLFILANQR